MRKIIQKSLAVLLAASTFLSVVACTNPSTTEESSGQATTTNTTQSSDELYTSLQTNYGFEPDYAYTKPVHNAKGDVKFEFPSEFSPEGLGQINVNDEFTNGIIDVFIDKDLTLSADPIVKYDTDTKTYTVSANPASRPLVYSEAYISQDSAWGLAGSYYMVLYYDLETGEKLEKPEITIFDLESEVDAPIISFKKSDTGLASYEWTEVPGADKYHVYILGNAADRPEVIAKDVPDNWIIHDDATQYGSTTLFNMFYRDTDASSYTYAYVIAEKDGKFSNASNLLSVKQFQSGLIYNFAGKDPQMRIRFTSPDQLLSTMPVEMCDGNVVMYPVTYQFDQMKVQTLLEAYGREISGVDMTQVFATIPVVADDTELSQMVLIEDYDYPEFEEDLRKAIESLESEKGKSGASPTPEISVVEDQSESEEENSSAGTTSSKEATTSNNEFNSDLTDTIYATNPLSAYLAANMLEGNSYIDLTMVNEASDVDILLDSFYEAYYQNPLILQVNGLAISRDGSMLLVEYAQDQTELKTKQKEIQTKVTEIVQEVTTDSMTDIEKEFALNDYLCNLAEYDFDVLNYALENDMEVGNEYRDAFTAYGTLLNQKGVCASYAAAYKLLADEAGLECIVVTGYLNGNLAHAWNRVNIEGNWLSVDTTNNDNEILSNSLLNLSDSIAATTLVEDGRYLSDATLPTIIGETEDYEFYRVSGKYFSVEEMGGELSQVLSTEQSATLRTKSDLTSQEIETILVALVSTPEMSTRQAELMEANIYENLGVITIQFGGE